MNSIPYLGEMLALLTAVTWAVGVVLFKKSGETVHPVALNLFKNVLAVTLILPTICFFGESLFPPASRQDYLLLLISGVLGIGIADTLFFKSLNLLGAGLSAIVECLYSPFVIILSVLWLDERLGCLQIIGSGMIVSAVLAGTGRNKADRCHILPGLICGILAVASLSVSLVMIKPTLEHAPVLWAAGIRMFGGLAVLSLILALNPRRISILSSLATKKGWKYTFFGSFAGAYLVVIFWLSGMKFAQASVAAALNQTSTIFIFILGAVFLREPVNRQRIAAIFMGFTGSFLVIFS